MDGQREWVEIRDWDDGSEDFEQLGKDYLRTGGAQFAGKIGLADSLLVPQRELVDFAIQWMAENRTIDADLEVNQA